MGFICHKQPTLEKHLRKSMMKTHFSDLRTSCTVEHIAEDDNWVYCGYRDQTGKNHRVKARFLVGADGKTGFTRKNYLEPLGIHMEQAHRYGSANVKPRQSPGYVLGNLLLICFIVPSTMKLGLLLIGKLFFRTQRLIRLSLFGNWDIHQSRCMICFSQ